MSALRARAWLLALATLATLAAAADSPADTERPAATTPRAAAKALQRGTPGKPTAPFAVEHSLAARPALFEPVAIDIVVRALADVANVAVTFAADETLVLADAAPLGAAALARGEALTGRVTVTPLAVGRAHLSVLVEGEVNGQPQARSVAIAIAVPGDDVAGRPAAPLQSVPTEPAGRDEQAIRSLPAEERVR